MELSFSSRTAIFLGVSCLSGLIFSSATPFTLQAAPAGSVSSSTGNSPGKSKSPDVKVQLQAFRVERVDGVEKLVLAEQAQPGDIIEYQARFRNTGTAPAKDLKPVLPIPESLIYLGNSARPVQFWASTDSKNFAPAPLKRRVKGTDGKIRLVVVPLTEYRNLRWNAGTLAPGQSVTVKARARVSS